MYLRITLSEKDLKELIRTSLHERGSIPSNTNDDQLKISFSVFHRDERTIIEADVSYDSES